MNPSAQNASTFISISTCRQNGNISTLSSPKDDSVIHTHCFAFFAKGKPLIDGAV
ncbi:hypothetical protein I656_00988 [Geobacillus sp. WSUCF1]|nr:hypothetical protein I656_00988 [Geobacillus sp. WSUCF1]